MVRHGWAIAYKYFSKEFVEDELFARNKKLGIWKGTFINPRDWRKKNRIIESNLFIRAFPKIF